MASRARPELVCPAGTPAALRTAIDAGADAVYCGFNDETNARNFPGLNFSRAQMRAAIEHAHQRETKIFIAINTFPQAGNGTLWHRAIDDGADFGADAVILADVGLLAYAAKHYPGMRRHLSVQAAASSADAIDYYVQTFGVRRVVLPRVLTIGEITSLNSEIDCETESFVFGGLCVMAEGRCSLSSYVTGKSPNMNGVCSPASHVTFRHEGDELLSVLGDYTIHRVNAATATPYPTVCKGCFATEKFKGHLFEDPASLDVSALIPELAAAGVTALKVEGRQRSRAYIDTVVRELRRAIDSFAADMPIKTESLRYLSEGQATTQGAYRKAWR